MCNLYTVRDSLSDIAAHFGATLATNFNSESELYPKGSGMAVRQADGARMLQGMTWGFPRRPKGMKPTSQPIPVNNIADIRGPFWIGLAKKPQWRVVIPLNEFAEAEGPEKAKTRTWFTLKDQTIFGWAGLWRVSDEWGPVYSGAMRNANAAIAQIHNRMPVLLRPEEYDTWLNGTFEDCVALQEREFPSELIGIRQTDERWYKAKPKVAAAGTPSLF